MEQWFRNDFFNDPTIFLFFYIFCDFEFFVYLCVFLIFLHVLMHACGVLPISAIFFFGAWIFFRGLMFFSGLDFFFGAWI